MTPEVDPLLCLLGSWGPGAVLGVPAPEPEPDAPPEAEPLELELPGLVVEPGLLRVALPEVLGLLEGLEGEADFDDEPDDEPAWSAPRSQPAIASAAATAAATVR